MNKKLVNRRLPPSYLKFVSSTGGAVVVGLGMVLSLGFLFFARAQLIEGEFRLNDAKAEMQQVLALEGQEQTRAKLNELMKELFAQAGRQGLLRQDWNERKVSITGVTMSREEANDLLADMSNNAQQIFGASQFEFSVRDTESGLFEAPTSRDNADLAVTLKGSAVFRTAPSSVATLTSQVAR